MRWAAMGATVAAGVAALGLLAPSAEAAKRSSCDSRGSTEVRNELVRVYELSKSDDTDSHELKACYYKTRKRTSLYSWFDCSCSVADEPSPDEVWLGGRFVAVETHTATGPPGAGGPTPSTYSVELYDAKRGKSLRSFLGFPERLVIKPSNGSIAYTEHF